jgi:hypothetical protein
MSDREIFRYTAEQLFSGTHPSPEAMTYLAAARLLDAGNLSTLMELRPKLDWVMVFNIESHRFSYHGYGDYDEPEMVVEPAGWRVTDTQTGRQEEWLSLSFALTMMGCD